MSNPYWLLGSSMIYDHSRRISEIIVGYLKGTNQLSEVQSYWDSQLKEYGKLWASSRVLWNGGAKKWREVFKNRDKLDQFTTKDQVVDRQKGASYKFSYARRLLGWNRILRIGYYMVIYYLRLNFERYYEKFQAEYRTKSLVDLSDDNLNKKLRDFNNHLRRGIENQIPVEST